MFSYEISLSSVGWFYATLKIGPHYYSQALDQKDPCGLVNLKKIMFGGYKKKGAKGKVGCGNSSWENFIDSGWNNSIY